MDESQLVENAKLAGLEYLGDATETSDRTYRSYRFVACGHVQDIIYLTVGKHKHQCKTCWREQIIETAKERGLEYLGDGDKPEYGKYRFIKCGHIQDICRQTVKHGTFKCQSCFVEHLNKQANAVGLEYVEKYRYTQYRKYRFIKCGHTKLLRVAQLKSGNIVCKACQYNEQSSTDGLEFVKDYGKHDLRKQFRFTKCGHTIDITLKQLRERKIVCRECEMLSATKKLKDAGIVSVERVGNGKTFIGTCKKCKTVRTIHNINREIKPCRQCKLVDEATTAGLELVGECDHKGYRMYRVMKCGHLQKIAIYNVRIGSYSCHQCFDEQLTYEASNHGLQFVGRCGLTGGLRRYRFIECGHVQDISLLAVRAGRVRCDKCYNNQNHSE